MKGTKFNRLLLQLQVKTHRTAGIDAGLLLKTPTASDWRTEKLTPGEGEIGSLSQQAISGRLMKHIGMLPTPATRDANNAEYPDKYQKRKEYQAMKGVNLEYPLRQFAMDINPTGKTSQLNPRFVAEMMGFPPNWTELPFLSGEMKA
jgi:hypothetical protein